jgi:plasmid stabilization system protein ParE
VRRVIISAAAQLELRAAANWYSDQEAGLGEELVSEVNRALEDLAEGAHRPPIWRPGRTYQKVRLHRFPYVVFFTHDDEHVHVLAIAHRKRKPGYWLKR